jgi:hypothetical protein
VAPQPVDLPDNPVADDPGHDDPTAAASADPGHEADLAAADDPAAEAP